MIGWVLCHLGYHKWELVIDKETLKTFPMVDYYHICQRCAKYQRACVVG